MSIKKKIIKHKMPIKKTEKKMLKGFDLNLWTVDFMDFFRPRIHHLARQQPL